MGVQVAGGLVGQNDLGTVCQGSCDSDPLLLPAGELIGHVPGPVGKTDLVQQGKSGLQPFLSRNLPIDHRQLHILERAGSRDQIKGLENKTDLPVADLRQFVVGLFAHIDPFQIILPFRGTVQAAQDIHERGLAGAGGAHDGDKFAPIDRYGHFVQGLDRYVAVLVGFRQLLDPDDLLIHVKLPSLLRGEDEYFHNRRSGRRSGSGQQGFPGQSHPRPPPGRSPLPRPG